MNFSLLIPTRKRPKLLANLLASIQKTTKDINNIEVLIAYDSDDKETEELLSTSCCTKNYVRERGKSLSKDYQNWLYKKSCGKYIFVLNDDVEFKTMHWDEIALSKINTNIFYGWIADNNKLRLNDYSCFPLLSRIGIDRLGYVMHEHYGGWSADVFLYKVYKTAGRVIDLSNILVQHYSHWLGNREKDETTNSMKEKSIKTDIIDHIPESKKLIAI